MSTNLRSKRTIQVVKYSLKLVLIMMKHCHEPFWSCDWSNRIITFCSSILCSRDISFALSIQLLSLSSSFCFSPSSTCKCHIYVSVIVIQNMFISDECCLINKIYFIFIYTSFAIFRSAIVPGQVGPPVLSNHPYPF